MYLEISDRVNPDKAPSPKDPKTLLCLVLDIGEEMLTAGGEVNRVEDSIYRMLTAYGYRKVNVFTITEFISVSFLDPEGRIVSESRRVYKHENNMHHLEDLNELSRRVCGNPMTVRELYDALNEMKPVKYSQNPWVMMLAYFLGSGGFAVFFDGSIIDGIVAGFIGILIYLSGRFTKVSQMNKFLYIALAALLSGFAAILLKSLGIGEHLDKIMIGDIMLLIPGLALTTSFRDVMRGDIIAGLLRFIESIFIAAAIAVGYALPLMIYGGLL